jgi:alpha-N-arabinofuranosidase
MTIAVFAGMEMTQNPADKSATNCTSSPDSCSRWLFWGRERLQRATMTAELALTASAQMITMAKDDPGVVPGVSIWEISDEMRNHAEEKASMFTRIVIALALLAVCPGSSFAMEYHVAKTGSDTNDGTPSAPLLRIQSAADLAQPGDTIVVHEGIYRERINPPRGGASDNKRIVYRAAEGEKVVIKGSEPIKDWVEVEHDTWKVTLPNSFFGDFNPYQDLIAGDWFYDRDRDHHTGAVYLDNHWLTEAANLDDALKPIGDTPLWFAEVGEANTTIWAQFKGVNPNDAQVEINVRESVFYPDKPGVNYITVRGFTLEHAATNWAPPTAEQVGLIGTHWSKGWVIEENTIRYSVCTGVTLGKHGDEHDNKSEDSAEGYVETINRALEHGWAKENIGHHVVRNNHISHCEQAGMVGSMGCAFSEVTGNTIHDIHVRRLFSGAEMAGIKFHGAVDTLIARNHVYRTSRGIWLDWMTQGTRVSRNLLHDNGPDGDLSLEVNHGPCLIDNNIMLSGIGILVDSQGDAYAHNLVSGRIEVSVGEERLTPYLKEHSTEVAGLAPNLSGDERYYNNVFVNDGLAAYDLVEMPVFMAGNVFLNGAKPSKHDSAPLSLPDFDPEIALVERGDGVYLEITLDDAWTEQERELVTTKLLGKAEVPDLPYVQPDGAAYRINTDYFGEARNVSNPAPGPFRRSAGNPDGLKVWPKEQPARITD